MRFLSFKSLSKVQAPAMANWMVEVGTANVVPPRRKPSNTTQSREKIVGIRVVREGFMKEVASAVRSRGSWDCCVEEKHRDGTSGERGTISNSQRESNGARTYLRHVVLQPLDLPDSKQRQPPKNSHLTF